MSINLDEKTLLEIRTQAMDMSETPGTSSIWILAWNQLALAADHLEAMMRRTEVVHNEAGFKCPSCSLGMIRVGDTAQTIEGFNPSVLVATFACTKCEHSTGAVKVNGKEWMPFK